VNEFSSYFDQISIINLPYRVDRQEEMREELAKVQLTLNQGHIELFEAYRPENKGKFPNIGAFGCFMSHLGVLKKAQKAGVTRLLIMEDDLTINKSWQSQSQGLISELENTKWDIVYFGHELHIGQTTETAFIEFNESILLAHFYAVHSRVFTRLIDFLELVASREAGDPLGGPMHVDGAISTFRQQNADVTTLVATSSFGGQRPSRTDIHELKWFDRVSMLRGGVNFLRRIKQKLG